MTLLFSLPDYARSVGLSDHQAATLNAVLNLGTAVGRPLIEIASDRLGGIKVAGVIILASGLLYLVMWLLATSYAVLPFFSCFYWGHVWCLLSSKCNTPVLSFDKKKNSEIYRPSAPSRLRS